MADVSRVRIDAAASAHTRRLAATVGAALAFGTALFVVSLEPWHGPTLLALSPSHGVDTGDLVVAPLIALALVLVRLGAGTASSADSDEVVRTTAQWLGPLSAVLLGDLLLIVGISRVFTAPGGPYDRPLAVAVVAAAMAFGTELVRTAGRWTGRGGRSWRIAVGLLVFGFLLDLALEPVGTVFCVLVLSVWFACTASSRLETIVGWLVAGTDGGVARAVALGGFLVVAGLLRTPRSYGSRGRGWAGERTALKRARPAADPKPVRRGNGTRPG
jgi:hypothetical protein